MSPQTGPKPMQDVSAPISSAPTSDLLQTELEHGIPVKHPDQPAHGNNPITQSGQFSEDGSKSDPELDHILKDVNNNVAEQDKNAGRKPRFSLFKKSTSKKAEAGAKSIPPKPIIAAFAAIIIAGVLGVAAVYAFKQKETLNSQTLKTSVPSKVGTSTASSSAVQAAGGTLVQPGDLNNLSSSLQSKINSLSDDQDFNQADLSDQKLGL